MVTMLMRLVMKCLPVIAMLCIVMTSVASAAQMAPAGANAPQYQAFVAAGGLDDLCETAGLEHADHACPFCRLLADPDDLTHVTTTWQLEAQDNPQRLVSVAVQDQLRQQAAMPRGPPLRVVI